MIFYKLTINHPQLVYKKGRFKAPLI